MNTFTVPVSYFLQVNETIPSQYKCEIRERGWTTTISECKIVDVEFEYNGDIEVSKGIGGLDVKGEYRKGAMIETYIILPIELLKIN